MRIPLMMALTLIILSVAVDSYIFADIRRNFPRRRAAAIAYGILSVLCWIFILICILMPRRDVGSGIEFQMWGIYAYLSVYVPKIIFTLFSILGGFPRLFGRRTWHTGKWIGLPLAVISFVAMWWGALVTRSQIEVVDVNISSPRIPKSFNGYRIVQISDLHVGTWGNDTRFISRLCDSVNALRPDAIFFTGDIVNRQTGELQPFLRALSGLKAKDGVYSILGNHDYGDYIDWPTPQEKNENLQLLKNWQRQIGWRLLNNERTDLIANGDTIQLIGVENWGEPPFHQYGHLLDAYPLSTDSVKNLKDNRYKILLTHNPEHWLREVTKISNIDLTLSGHTHAMQFELRLGNWKWSPSALRYATWGGLYSRPATDGTPMKLYVNIGAGEVGMPFRIGATPEITVITLHSAPDGESSPAKEI
ncbi:MAG: metallophosphoesterase [Muribaculaceae bacterium]|nr:metallophosphoesterase [Muribaculaceae bacterium]